MKRLIPIAYSPAGDPEGQWIQVHLEEGGAVGWVTAIPVFDEEDGIGPSPYAIAFDTIKHQAYVADTTTDQITMLGGW